MTEDIMEILSHVFSCFTDEELAEYFAKARIEAERVRAALEASKEIEVK